MYASAPPRQASATSRGMERTDGADVAVAGGRAEAAETAAVGRQLQQLIEQAHRMWEEDEEANQRQQAAFAAEFEAVLRRVDDLRPLVRGTPAGRAEPRPQQPGCGRRPWTSRSLTTRVSARRTWKRRHSPRTTSFMAWDVQDLVWRAKWLIRRDWLNLVDEIGGNIYRSGAFGGFWSLDEGWRSWDRLVGFVFIVLFQVVGSITLFGTPVFDWSLDGNTKYCDFTKWEPSLAGWEQMKTTKLLNMCFVEAFLLNSVFSVVPKTSSRGGKQFKFLIFSTAAEPGPVVRPGDGCFYVAWSALGSFFGVAWALRGPWEKNPTLLG